MPPLLGTISYEQSGTNTASVLMLQPFVSNQGNAWDVTIEELGRFFDRVKALPTITPGVEAEIIGPYLSTAEILGRRTGELHAALASAGGRRDFEPDVFSVPELKATARRMRQHATEELKLLDAAMPRLDDWRRELARELLSQRSDLFHHFDAVAHLRSGGARIRCHGDYHLGQVLITEADVVIIDFEGEPARPLAERRQKSSPLRDVAGMLRSFSYAAQTGLGVATHTRPEDADRLSPWARMWEVWVGSAFLGAYRAAIDGSGLLPGSENDLDALLRAFVVDKALYELAYELNNRPDWVHIPLRGLLALRTLNVA